MGWPLESAGGNFSRPVYRSDVSGVVAVSTETTLLDWTDLSDCEELYFIVENESANLVRLYHRHSLRGTRENDNHVFVDIAAGDEGWIQIERVRNVFHKFTAAGDPDGGFPSSNVRYALVVVRRRPPWRW